MPVHLRAMGSQRRTVAVPPCRAFVARIWAALATNDRHLEHTCATGRNCLVMRGFVWVIGTFAMLGGLKLMLQQFLPKCETQVMSSTEISEDGWRLMTRGFACGFGISGGVDIVAANSKLNKTYVVAIGDDVGDTSIKAITNNSFLVTLRNRSDVEIKPVSTPGITIEFNFLPQYDQDDREHYQAWRKDAANETVMPTINQPNRNMIDKTLAYTNFIPHGSRKSYCS